MDLLKGQKGSVEFNFISTLFIIALIMLINLYVYKIDQEKRREQINEFSKKWHTIS